MNWARGFFRLWLVFTVIWVGAVAILLRPDKAALVMFGVTGIGVPFADNRAIINVYAGSDLTSEKLHKALLDLLHKDPDFAAEWALEAEVRAHGSAEGYRGITADEASEAHIAAFIETATEARSKALSEGRHTFSSFAFFGGLPPLMALLLAAALAWALRGFRRP